VGQIRLTNAGGPCRYTGQDLVQAHKGRSITGQAFDVVVEDLTATLDKLGVGAKEKSDLLNILAPMQAGIVEK
jgi:hemoglobin